MGLLTHWAEDGLVICEWQATAEKAGEIQVLSVRTAKNRLSSLAAELEVWDKARDGTPSMSAKQGAVEYYHQLRGYVEGLAETVKDAEQQGDQNDPEVRRQKLSQFLREKRAGTGLPNDTAQFFGGPEKAKPILFVPGGL